MSIQSLVFFVGLGSALLLVGRSPHLVAGEKDLSQRLKKSLEAAAVAESEVGISVQLAVGSEAETVFQVGADRAMIPASLTKIATLAAIIDRMPPSTTFFTQLMSEGKIDKGVLQGNLCLKGGGDSSFVSESLWGLVNKFTRTGIKTIKGAVTVDDSLFDSVRFDASREDERVDRAYDAPVGAASMNWNSINVFVRPGPNVGAPAQVFIDPEVPLIKVTSRATTSKSANSLQVSRSTSGEGVEHIAVSGALPMVQTEKAYYKSVSRPDLWTGHQLKSFLSQRQIQVAGNVVAKSCEKAARVLADWESKPTGLMVADMMKYSNNFVAEMLTKQLAVAAGELPGTLSRGLVEIRASLKKIGLEEKNFVLVNPSGLTRENRLRAVDIVQILRHLSVQALYGPEAMAAFPLSGLDGTLKSRLKSVAGSVRAKTGMLKGVVGLAGYVKGRSGRVFYFAFLFNGKTDKGEEARILFDQLAQQIAELG